MNKNAEFWVRALRSGEYKQTKKVLISAKGKRYCCMGVACILAAEAGVIEPERTDEFQISRTALPPMEVVDWLGLSNVRGGYVSNDEIPVQDALTAMNDAGLTFDEIAAIIESEPKGLFIES